MNRKDKINLIKSIASCIKPLNDLKQRRFTIMAGYQFPDGTPVAGMIDGKRVTQEEFDREIQRAGGFEVVFKEPFKFIYGSGEPVW